MTNAKLDELEALYNAATKALVNNAPEAAGLELQLSVTAINALPELVARVRELERENADLKTSVIAFAGPAAVRYAADFEMPEGHLAAHHYDLLEKCGARMTDFTRAVLKGTDTNT